MNENFSLQLCFLEGKAQNEVVCIKKINKIK